MRIVRLAFIVGLLGACSSTTVDLGHGGGGGKGGEPFPKSCSPADVTPPCDDHGKRCGDGAIDSCQVCSSTDGGPVTCNDVSESCDGQNLGGATCASLGYAGGGELGCSAACAFDSRDCDSCLGAPRQLACARPRVDGFDIASLTLASDGDVIAAAWVTFDRILHFARFDKDLSLIAENPCMTLSDGLFVALAPSAGGWAVAVGGTGDNPAVVIHRLDTDGVEISAPRAIADATAPVLATRPGATPLLVYTSTNFAGGAGEIKAELLDDQMAPMWTRSLSPKGNPEGTAAAFADPGFVVSVWPAGAMPPTAQEIAVDAAGNVSTAMELAGAREVTLAPGGSGRVAVMWRAMDGYSAGWLDASGKLAGTPAKIGGFDMIKATQEHRIVALGGKAVAMLAESMDQDISVAHLDASGAISTPKYALAREPFGTSWTAGTSSGDAAVFAWTNYAASEPAGTRFVLAKVNP